MAYQIFLPYLTIKIPVILPVKFHHCLGAWNYLGSVSVCIGILLSLWNSMYSTVPFSNCLRVFKLSGNLKWQANSSHSELVEIMVTKFELRKISCLKFVILKILTFDRVPKF